MPVRTAYDPTPGEVLTAANLKRLPGGWIGYVEVTANQTGITTEVDLTGLSVTVTVNSSRRIGISTRVAYQASAAAAAVTVNIKEGATYLTFGQAAAGTSAAFAETLSAMVVLTPTAGSHTYKLSMSGGSSTTMVASATLPAFILVEDLGPAS